MPADSAWRVIHDALCHGGEEQFERHCDHPEDVERILDSLQAAGYAIVRLSPEPWERERDLREALGNAQYVIGEEPLTDGTRAAWKALGKLRRLVDVAGNPNERATLCRYLAPVTYTAAEDDAYLADVRARRQAWEARR